MPPFHRSSSSARLSAGSRCTVMATSSSRCAAAACGPCRWWSGRATPSQVVGEGRTAARSVAVRVAGVPLAVRQLGFGVGLGLQGTLPFGFQATRHEPVFGSTARYRRSAWRPGSGPARPGGGAGPARCRSRPRAARRRPGRPAARRGQARPGTPGDGGVDRGTADPRCQWPRLAPGAPPVSSSRAWPCAPRRVDGGLAAADTAGGQGLQVRGALPDRAGARGAFRRRDVRVQPALDVLVGVPVDESVMVAGNEHFPLV